MSTAASATTALAVAVQSSQSLQTTLNAYVQAGLALSASLNVSVQGTNSANALLAAGVKSGRVLSTNLSALVSDPGVKEISVDISAALQSAGSRLANFSLFIWTDEPPVTFHPRMRGRPVPAQDNRMAEPAPSNQPRNRMRQVPTLSLTWRR